MARKIPMAQIEAAVRNVEDDVAEPSRRRSSSFASVLTDLQVGETASRAQLVDETATLREYSERSAQWREAFRNNCMPSVRQAKDRTGGDYTVEVTEVMTQSRKLYLVALVTRVA